MREIGDSIGLVREKILRASQKAGRSPEDVRLVAAAKGVDIERIRSALAAGITDVGENYIQEARGKIETLGTDICWHMIGHIQTNKLKYVPGLFRYVHSVDRPEVLEGLDKFQKKLDVLFEVNLSGEATKRGATQENLRKMMERVAGLKHIEPVGLMTMPPLVDDPERVRHIFAGLRELLSQVNKEFSLQMKELSMGMSSDFEVAVEEGATMVRIGTAIFGEHS